MPCAVDRSGNSLSIVATLGRIKTKDLAKSNKIELIQLKTGKSKRGVYHIQHINAYHSNLKNFIRIFKGVSTKYLNNYLLWNNWINVSQGSMQDKTNTLLRTVMLSTRVTIKCSKLSSRPPVPLAS